MFNLSTIAYKKKKKRECKVNKLAAYTIRSNISAFLFITGIAR